jgi:hypothetical protein
MSCIQGQERAFTFTRAFSGCSASNSVSWAIRLLFAHLTQVLRQAFEPSSFFVRLQNIAGLGKGQET